MGSATIAKKMVIFEELLGTFKKRVLVLATSVPMTDSSKEIVRVPCIHYSTRFLENQRQKK